MDKFYVYIFINDNWGVPFYVGKGSNGRYKEINHRSKHIQAICSHFNWHSKIVEYFNSEDKAYQYEQCLKLQYKELGFPIIDGEVNATHKEAQRIGIEKAKQADVYKGRKPIDIPNFESYYQKVCNKSITKTALAKELNITRPTLDKLISRYESTLTLQNDLTHEYSNNLKEWLQIECFDTDQAKQEFKNIRLTDEEAQACAENINIYIKRRTNYD